MCQVRYLVGDLAESIGFYTGALGFQVVEQFGPAMAIVERDGLRLWLAGPIASASRPMPDGRKPCPGGWNRIVLEVKDIEGVAALLRASGVIFRNNVVSGPGGQQILCDDPSGNPIELFQPRE